MRACRDHIELEKTWSKAEIPAGRRFTRVFSRRSRRALLCALSLPVLACLLTGCASRANPDLAGPTYPETLQGPTIDIQVVRDETMIRLTNTTVKSYANVRLWVNRWYSKPIEKFEVGQTLELSLWDFRDEYGESFEAGGFFATRKPDRLVQAQLQVGEELLGLVVVGRQEDLY